MTKFTLTAASQPDYSAIDPLFELLRSGARQLIAQAVEAELQALLDQHANVRLSDGRQAVVRNDHLPERTVQTGIGDVEVKVPKVRDRSGQESGSTAIFCLLISSERAVLKSYFPGCT